MTVAYSIKTESFEGPVEALLGLIEERKLHISRVSLSQVADNFLVYLNSPEKISKSQVSNFIWVAATLMLIKSISLLPETKLSAEEEQSIDELERRLKILQEIKKVGDYVREQYGKRVIFSREESGQLVFFAPSRDLTLTNLVTALRGLISSLPQKELLPQAIIAKTVTLKEIIERLTVRLTQAAEHLNFGELVKDDKEKLNVILHFLGILELVKQGSISARQERHFQEISFGLK